MCVCVIKTKNQFKYLKDSNWRGDGSLLALLLSCISLLICILFFEIFLDMLLVKKRIIQSHAACLNISVYSSLWLTLANGFGFGEGIVHRYRVPGALGARAVRHRNLKWSTSSSSEEE